MPSPVRQIRVNHQIVGRRTTDRGCVSRLGRRPGERQVDGLRHAALRSSAGESTTGRRDVACTSPRSPFSCSTR